MFPSASDSSKGLGIWSIISASQEHLDGIDPWSLNPVSFSLADSACGILALVMNVACTSEVSFKIFCWYSPLIVDIPEGLIVIHLWRSHRYMAQFQEQQLKSPQLIVRVGVVISSSGTFLSTFPLLSTSLARTFQ
jgi:hypothetical protein